MKTFALSLLLLAGALSVSAATEEKLNKRFTVQPGTKLVVDVDFGAVDVRTNASSEAVIDVWRKISRGNQADEQKFFKDNPVVFSQEGNTVTVRQKTKPKSNWSFSLTLNRMNQNDGRYIITVPAQFDVQVKTAGGNVLVQDLTGIVDAHTSGGALDFVRLKGPLDGHTSGGGIRVADCQGKLTIHTSGGPIDVKGGGGTLEGVTSGGGVVVKDFAGPARMETSGGGITVERVAGAIEGSTSGGGVVAVLLSPLPGPVKLSTSGGGVTARVPAGTAFDLDAEASGGGVSSQLLVAVSGKPASNRLKGPVNGGGKTVELRTSGGSIHVEKLEEKSAAR